MDKFRFKIGNLILGNDSNSTLLIGNIYTSELTDKNNKKKASTNLLLKVEELSKKLKIKNIYDLIIEDLNDLEESIKIISEMNDNPFSIDTASPKILNYAIKKIAEFGIIDRLVINSISESINENTIKLINRFGVENAIILTFNLKKKSVEGRIEVLKNTLKKIEDTTITNKLVDCTLIDIESIRAVVDTMKIVKNEYKLPVGCSPSNASYLYKKREPELLSKNFQSFDTSLNIILRSLGSDFLIYGPIKAYNRIFKSITLYNTIQNYFD